MMHAAGIHSALALRRARKRREEQRKARDRRLSSHSTESGLTSPRHSITSSENHRKHFTYKQGSESEVSSIGMLHIGVVFLVLGMFLLGSGLIPDDKTKGWAQQVWMNELVVSGTFLLVIGLFLLILNAIMSKREEDELHNYVQGQLTRSRSGHRLERDVETGVLMSKHHRRYRHPDGLLGDLSPVDEYGGHSVHHSPPVSAGSITNGHLDKIQEEESSIADRSEDGRNFTTTSHEEYRSFLHNQRSPSRENSPATPMGAHRQTVFTYTTSNFNGGRYAVTAKV